MGSRRRQAVLLHLRRRARTFPFIPSEPFPPTSPDQAGLLLPVTGGSTPPPPPHLPGHGPPRQRRPPGDIPHPYATSLFPLARWDLGAARPPQWDLRATKGPPPSSVTILYLPLPPLRPLPTTITLPSGPTAPRPAGGRFCSANSSPSSWTCPTSTESGGDSRSGDTGPIQCMCASLMFCFFIIMKIVLHFDLALRACRLLSGITL
jgi:hypothetical protein